jgi:hypothetical protein
MRVKTVKGDFVMTITARGRTPLLDAIHETASDLHRLRLIDDAKKLNRPRPH